LRDVGYRSAWIIGAVCPARDTGVALVMTRLDTAAMNLFLAELGQAVAPGAHGIVLMDKAGWHTAGDLVVPENLSLVFLPPYSPELNPIERLWLHLRETIASRTAFSRPLVRSSTPVVTLGIDCSDKPDASDPSVPIPGSNKSAINQVGIRPQKGSPAVTGLRRGAQNTVWPSNPSPTQNTPRKSLH
jgi:DDE superfamily endonuclease